MFRNMFLGSAMFNPLRAPEDESGGPEQTGGQEDAPIVAVEEAAVKAAEVAKAADEAKAKEQAELDLQKTEENKPKPEKDWRDKELGKKHAKLKEQERLLAEKEQRIKDLEEMAARATSQPTEQQIEQPARREVAPIVAKVDPEAVKAEARQLVQQEKFNEACVAAELKGKEVYKEDFEKAVSTIQTLGGFDAETMVGILATDDPSKVLYELGKNPDEYHRIMEMDTAQKRVVALTKLAMTAPSKPKLSEAPAPVEQVGGRGGATNSELRDDMSDDEWNAIRDRQEKARWAAKNGRAA